jgi:hypothetical protein
MKLAGNVSHFANSQYELQYMLRLLIGQDFAQVKAFITKEGINPRNVPALITVLEIAFGNPNHIVTVEQKLEALQQTSGNFSHLLYRIPALCGQCPME